MTADAARALLDERHVPLVRRSPSTVLLQFRYYVLRPPDERSAEHDEFYILWMDLDRRRIPVPAVIRAVLAPATARAMTARVFGSGADPVPARIGWWEGAELIGSAIGFRARATRRLVDLVDEDMGAFLDWRAPEPSELAALVPAREPTDPEGQRVWDRYVPADPGTIVAEHARARDLLADGQTTEATDLLEALTVLRPFDPDPVADLAEAVAGHDTDRAVLLRRRAASLRAVADAVR